MLFMISRPSAMRSNQRQQIILRLFIHLLLLNGTHFVSVHCQLLSRDLPAEPLCPGQVVIFTCETRGSPILAWTSDEYIERGGTQLEFATFNEVNDTRVSPVNPNTIATLIENKVEDGVRVLVSTLHVRALSGFLDSSVTCVHIGDGTMNTSRVQVIADAAAPEIRDSTLWLRNSTNDTVGTCVAELSWNSPINIDAMDILHYEIRFYGKLVANVADNGNNGAVSAVYIYDEDCDCTNRNEFSIRAVNRCNRPGGSSDTTLGPPKALRTLDCDGLDQTTNLPTVSPTFAPISSFSNSEFYGVVAALVVVAAYSLTSTSAFAVFIIIHKQKPKEEKRATPDDEQSADSIGLTKPKLAVQS